MSVRPRREQLRLRPGAAVYELSGDELQISFPNYTATFTSPAVVAAVRATVEAVGDGAGRAAVVRRAGRATELEPDVVEWIVDSLLGSGCLVSGPAGERTPLQEFHAYVGGPDDAAERLDEAYCAVVEIAGETPGVAALLAGAGVRTASVPAEPGTPADKVLAAVETALDDATTIACWNVPFRAPLARALNELALARRVPVLFGACEGVVGRVGPLVVPGVTPCLECMNLRLLSHAGAPELRSYREYRARHGELVPAAWPSHPLFAQGVAALFAVEALQLVLRLPSVAAGGFVEYRVAGADADRHTVLRVPTCPACRPQRAPRLAWDTRLAAPAVKGAVE